MKRADFIFALGLLPLDFLMLITAGMIPYFLRSLDIIQKSGIVSPIFYALPVYEYLLITAGIALLWLVFFGLNGLYGIATPQKFLDIIIKIAVSCTTGMSVVIIGIFFKRQFLFSSRFIVLTSWALAIILVILGRAVHRLARQSLFKKNIGLQNAVIIGNDKNTHEVASFLTKEKIWGYNVVDVLTHTKNLENKIKELSKKTPIHEIILSDLSTPREERLRILDFCNTKHLSFRYAADIFESHVRNIDIDTVCGVPLIEIRRTPLFGWGGLIKRIFDFWATLILGIILIPMFILTAIIIKLNSKGPVLVKLPRVGRGGKMFNLYKFRSMVAGAHKMKNGLMEYNERNDGPLFKMTDDPRVTRVGKFIRKWTIDEFPQFLNVIKGDISLVGPRAHEPEEVKRYKKHQKKLLYITPGIVCIAAISGRSGLKFEEEVRLDTYYIENWSFAMDLNILLKTPFVILSRKNAV